MAASEIVTSFVHKNGSCDKSLDKESCCKFQRDKCFGLFHNLMERWIGVLPTEKTCTTCQQHCDNLKVPECSLISHVLWLSNGIKLSVMCVSVCVSEWASEHIYIYVWVCTSVVSGWVWMCVCVFRSADFHLLIFVTTPRRQLTNQPSPSNFESEILKEEFVN